MTTLNEFIELLKGLVEEDPEHGERVVIMSRDPEGNGFSEFDAWGTTNFDPEDDETYSDEEDEEDNQDFGVPDSAVPALILWPSR